MRHPPTASPFAAVPDFSVPLRQPEKPGRDASGFPWRLLVPALIGLPLYYLRRLIRG